MTFCRLCSLAVIFVISSLFVGISIYMKKLADNMGERD